jgi:hypothetical protein
MKNQRRKIGLALPREVEPLLNEGRTVLDCLEEERGRRSGGFL